MRDADSIACDPHKWLYAPIDAGVLLVRNPGLLAASFAFHASYLHARPDTDGRMDLAELGPENSRRARGIKVWMALQPYGFDGYRDMIERNIQLAAYMERLVQAEPYLVLAAPRELSIVCWRVEPEDVPDDRLDGLQVEVIEEFGATRYRDRVERAAAGRPDRAAGMHRQVPDEPGTRGSGGASERGDRTGARRERLPKPGIPRLSNRTVQGL